MRRVSGIQRIGLLLPMVWLWWSPTAVSFLPRSKSSPAASSRMLRLSCQQKNATNFCRALAVVPPTQDWDRLQRARHYARDAVFHEWPPCLRLFHPFDADALEVANAVEELDLQAFSITFENDWVIVPHLEQVEVDWEATKEAPLVEYSDVPTESDEDEAVRRLIAEEERKSRIKAQARVETKHSQQQQQQQQQDESDDKKESPEQALKEQQKKYQEFGGPCILCLEPDADSKQRLMELRQELAMVLGHDDYFSPSSVYSWQRQSLEFGYRPLLTISKFESLPAAMDVARRLKGLWGEPLTLTIKDLHVISQNDAEEEEEYSTEQSPEEWNQIPWGRSAVIKLMGEEVEQDSKANERMVKKLVEEGTAGGLDISMDYTILDDEEETWDIEHWLDSDDEWDEGTQVVIGRTHFYTGDQRAYVGMPASSVVDARDRSMGEGGMVSAIARRRGAVSRHGSMWEDGEYGRRDADFVPWNKRERVNKKKTKPRLLDGQE